MRMLPAPVEDAGDQPLTAQTAGITGSPSVPLPDGQLDALAGHGGEV
jgi:hypothetical protein